VKGRTPVGPPPECGEAAVAWTLSAAAHPRPYLMHGSIGPSAAMVLWQEGSLEAWTHSQGDYVLLEALAAALALPHERIRVSHVVGPGCYGHNSADDAFDAVLPAMATPGAPPGLPFLGVGEATPRPTAAAIANAAADAVGLRLRELPFTPERVRAAALRA